MDNHYGLIFATRLKTPPAEGMFLSDDNTPSVQAELLGPHGQEFKFIGLYPRPPVPGKCPFADCLSQRLKRPERGYGIRIVDPIVRLATRSSCA